MSEKTLTLGSGRIARRLKELGIELPLPTSSPSAKIEGFVLASNWLFISGQIPQWSGEHRFIGKVGESISLEQGQAAARLCAQNVLSCAHVALSGDLDRVQRIVKVTGLVNATPDYVRVHEVVNGASELFIDVFGDVGRHARTASGASVMLFGVAVEIEAIIAVA